MAYIVAGVALLLLFMVWMIATHRELSGKRKAVLHAAEELNIHHKIYETERDGPQREQAARMLDISRRLFEESQRVYQTELQTPLYRIPGALMGFYAVTREE